MNVVRSGATAAVVALFAVALVLMTREQLLFAGLTFLGASVLIYLRETQL